MPQACGGGDGGTCHLRVDDAGVVADVSQVDIGQGIQEEDTVGAHGERQETTDTYFVGGASTLGLPLEALAELHGILEGHLHHAQV